MYAKMYDIYTCSLLCVNYEGAKYLKSKNVLFMEMNHLDGFC